MTIKFQFRPLALLALSLLSTALAFAPSTRISYQPAAVTLTKLSASLEQQTTAVIQELRRKPATSRGTTKRRRRYNVIDERSLNDPSSLTFSGQIIKTSRPLATSVSDREGLIEFFKSTSARDTLFVSDAPPVPVAQPIPATLMNEWQAETKRLGITVPQNANKNDDQQIVMQLCSKGISFSGLTVETTVNCGAKLIECADDTGLPAYEFTMINDKTQARGPKPLMWIYNQVMGLVSSSSNRRRGGQQQPQKTTTSLCRIALVEIENGGLAIDFESSFQVQMKFPSFLLRILPVSKSRAQQQGSSAVTRFVQKGVMDSVERFEKTFLLTTQQQQQRLAP